MPQMAPISWLILFFLFSMSFIIFNIMNYFSFLVTNNIKENNNDNKLFSKTNLLTWKW